jgi:hypothetical protein
VPGKSELHRQYQANHVGMWPKTKSDIFDKMSESYNNSYTVADDNFEDDNNFEDVEYLSVNFDMPSSSSAPSTSKMNMASGIRHTCYNFF